MDATDRLHEARGTGALHIHQDEHGQWFAMQHDGRDPHPLPDNWLGNVVALACLVVAAIGCAALFAHAMMPSIR